MRLVSHQPLTAAQGNTIIEYTLIGSLIVLVCIGGFQLIGGNFNSYMVGLKDDMLSHNKATANTKAAQQQQIANAQAQVQQQTQAMANGSQQLNSASGTAASSGATPQTVGANGNTNSYASDIMSNANQALASGSLTQDEYDLVVKLANKGHDIAMIQGLLEGAYKQSSGNSAAYANTNLTFNGQSYTPSQLNAVLESNIGDFGSLKTQASVLNGVLYNQSLLTSINDNGAKIINNGYSSQQQNQTADSFIQYQNEGLGGGSADTHGESAVICTNGQHVDSGQHCSP